MRKFSETASIAPMNSVAPNPSLPLQNIPLKRIDGSLTSPSEFHGKVLLIVNTASQCGFTQQYAGLEDLYRKYRERGLVVLGFPCNQFGAQEPGADRNIADFCDNRFRVNFPMFSKVKVNGPETHPWFALLKQQAPGLLGTTAIKWNFTKFLVGRNGLAIQRFAPWTSPDKLTAAIEDALAA